MIKTMNGKMTTNSQLKTKQTTRTETESQKWRSHGELPAGIRKGKNGGKGTVNKKHHWYAQKKTGGD